MHGGWTNRYTTEAAAFFAGNQTVKRGWIVTMLWVSDPPDLLTIRRSVHLSVARAAWIIEHGLPLTLRAMLAQEGHAAWLAGLTPELDEEELAYSRSVIDPLLDTTAYPICFAAMYGDAAAVAVGYPSLGLPERAGFSVACADCTARNSTGRSRKLQPTMQGSIHA
ncbi:MAG: hypothetical protein NVS4B8_24310 [Herpetosiphon sp.]